MKVGAGACFIARGSGGRRSPYIYSMTKRGLYRKGDVRQSEHFCSEVIGSLEQFAHALREWPRLIRSSGPLLFRRKPSSYLPRRTSKNLAATKDDVQKPRGFPECKYVNLGQRARSLIFRRVIQAAPQHGGGRANILVSGVGLDSAPLLFFPRRRFVVHGCYRSGCWLCGARESISTRARLPRGFFENSNNPTRRTHGRKHDGAGSVYLSRALLPPGPGTPHSVRRLSVG
jgi:hypothetical protein